MSDKTPKIEKTVLAGLHISQTPKDIFDEDLAEMELLCTTAGAQVVQTIVQKTQKPLASTYFGSGKLKEIKQVMEENDCETLVIDAELRPSQIQNIEEIVEKKIIDRSQLILDIFSLHARTAEAKIQVELAQLETLYPRLTNMWAHLSRMHAGVGTRGPGETQLETDRRIVQKKISQLKDRLKKIEKIRQTQSKLRESTFLCALVGYTNVGKSTLLNMICGSDVLVENKLFATLDTSTRRTHIVGAGDIVMSDTVGFLRKLPHHLVASFRSTLETLVEADLLLIVMDASTKWYKQQMQVVREVIADLGAGNKPVVIIFNKEDLLENPFDRIEIEKEYPNAKFVSALDKKSTNELKAAIGEAILSVKRVILTQEAIKQKQKPKIIAG
ncbi:MAG: GTPase HflX [Chitinispirillales bacterium]|jgi:GTP-binding protein HflX|nr:GTPase HflX [Chitinispirillales bacterium]